MLRFVELLVFELRRSESSAEVARMPAHRSVQPTVSTHDHPPASAAFEASESCLFVLVVAGPTTRRSQQLVMDGAPRREFYLTRNCMLRQMS